jgi:ubiquitin-activating enzyme E1
LISIDSIGSNLDIASKEKHFLLNSNVDLQILTGKLDFSILSCIHIDCFILTSFSPFNNIVDLDHDCHKLGIKFIIVLTFGVFGFAFNDFGKDFIIQDPIGVQPERVLINKILSDGKIMILSEEYSHKIDIGDSIIIHDIE